MAHTTSQFDQRVRDLMEEWRVPGLSMAIVHGDEIDAKVMKPNYNTWPKAHANLGLRLRQTSQRALYYPNTLRLCQHSQVNYSSSRGMLGR